MKSKIQANDNNHQTIFTCILMYIWCSETFQIVIENKTQFLFVMNLCVFSFGCIIFFLLNKNQIKKKSEHKETYDREYVLGRCVSLCVCVCVKFFVLSVFLLHSFDGHNFVWFSSGLTSSFFIYFVHRAAQLNKSNWQTTVDQQLNNTQ